MTCGNSDEIRVVESPVRACASDVYLHLAAENIQIHGGIGFTREHDTHPYFKQAKASSPSPRVAAGATLAGHQRHPVSSVNGNCAAPTNST
jgi:hypothetical protein